VTFRVWCQHAWLGGPSSSDGVLLEIDNGRFSRVETGFASPPPGIAALPGLTMPGIVNPHHKALERVARGQIDSVVAAAASSVQNGIAPEDLCELATAVYAELSLAGITTIGEVVTLHRERDGAPFANPNVIADALVHAAKTAGVRLAIIDVCVLNGPPRVRHGSVHEWMQRVDPWTERLGRSDTVKMIGGLADQSGLGTRGLADVALWSGQCGLPVHATIDIPSVDGVSPLTALAHASVTTNRGGFSLLAPHKAGAEQLASVAQQRGSVVAVSGSQLEPFPIGAFRMSGGRIALAQSSAIPVDSFGALRSLERMASQDGGGLRLSSSELMRTITADAAVTLGWRDSGVLASGQLADLVTVRTQGLAHSSDPDILHRVVHHARSSDITHVAVGGQLLVNNGRHRLGDIDTLMDRAIGRVERFTTGVFR
jgi:cytosine/adenosine deaminase-related metal-dependent hydrolase